MAAKTFIVSRNDAQGKLEEIEIKAERAEQQEGTRVTFFNGDEPVASFINIQGWYEKTK